MSATYTTFHNRKQMLLLRSGENADACNDLIMHYVGRPLNYNTKCCRFGIITFYAQFCILCDYINFLTCRKYKNDRLVAAVLATLLSCFSNALRVSTAFVKSFCLRYMTALLISRSLASWEC